MNQIREKLTHWGRVHPYLVFGPMALAVSLMNASFVARQSLPVAYVQLMAASYLIFVVEMMVICCVSCKCKAHAHTRDLESARRAVKLPLLLNLCVLILSVASCLLSKRLILVALVGMQVAIGIPMIVDALYIKSNG